MTAPQRPEQPLGNQHVFDSPAVVGEFDGREGWIDNGEKLATLFAASATRGGAILDLGVGAGRTTSLLRLISDDYVGVDYSPTMVAACRRRNQYADVRIGDARDLGDFDDGQFDLVVFSYNGIDAMSHEERPEVLREMARVLKPQGLLLFSTLNRDGRSFGERPWQLHRPGAPIRFSLRRFASFVLHLPSRGARYYRSYANWWRNRRLATSGDQWAIAPLRSHEFAPLVHFTTVGRLRAELHDTGLRAEQILCPNGEQVASDVDRISGPGYFHVICQHEQPGRTDPEPTVRGR